MPNTFVLCLIFFITNEQAPIKLSLPIIIPCKTTELTAKKFDNPIITFPEI